MKRFAIATALLVASVSSLLASGPTLPPGPWDSWFALTTHTTKGTDTTPSVKCP